MILLLFLIFAGCAVKCDESQTFVVQMPDPPPRNLHIYWNVPTKQCKSKKIYFDGLGQFGIIQNENDRFRGEEITILYDPGYFPALFRNESTNELTYRNGGVPQEGDLDLHLKRFAGELTSSIPDANFSGVGIIDFESWRPIFRQNFGEVYPYQAISIDIEQRKYWWLPSWIVKDKAKKRFEEAARTFMQYTIAVAQRLRPLARWGYYGFPYCFNTTPKNKNEDCPSNVAEENDQIKWLWANSTALYPSVYSSSDLSTSVLIKRVRGRVREAARVRSRNAAILPYFSYRYRDEGYFTETDLNTVLKTIYASDATGLIIWGSSNDVDTLDKCKKLHKYIYNVFGPIVAQYANYKKYHKQENQTVKYDYDKFTDNDVKNKYSISTQFDENLTTSNPFSTNETQIRLTLETSTTTNGLSNHDDTTENTTEQNTNIFNQLSDDENVTKNTMGENKSSDDIFNVTTLDPITEFTSPKDFNFKTSTYYDDYKTTTLSTDTLESENTTERKDDLLEDDDFATKDPIQDDDTTKKLTPYTKINQVIGWAYIFSTIMRIINDTKDNVYNETTLPSQSSTESSDLKTSTYLEANLLMNNLSDFKHTIRETTENIVTSTSTEATNASDYNDLKITDLIDLPKKVKHNITDANAIMDKFVIEKEPDNYFNEEITTVTSALSYTASVPESLTTNKVVGETYENTENIYKNIKNDNLLRNEEVVAKSTKETVVDDFTTTASPELYTEIITKSDLNESKEYSTTIHDTSKDLIENEDLTTQYIINDYISTRNESTKKDTDIKSTTSELKDVIQDYVPNRKDDKTKNPQFTFTTKDSETRITKNESNLGIYENDAIPMTKTINNSAGLALSHKDISSKYDDDNNGKESTIEDSIDKADIVADLSLDARIKQVD